MTDTTMHSVQLNNETASIDIAILVSNEVLERPDLEAIIKSLEGVGTVRRCTSHLAAMQALRDERLDVVILTARPRPGYADGHLSQHDLSASVLDDCLRRTSGVEAPLHAERARALPSAAGTALAATVSRSARLTGRETEVLHMLAQGLSNKQIANRLSISSHGVKRLVGNIMMKLDAPNRTAAVVSAIKAGLLQPE